MLSTPLEYVRAEEHVLPYRVLFEELLCTGHAGRTSNGKNFPEIVAAAFREGDPAVPTPTTTQEQAEKLIFDRITAVEKGYRELAFRKAEREYATGDERSLSQLEAPLLRILHQLERSALCLSGGGIRSAALCLGALQALARFRDRIAGSRYDNLALPSALEEFDYLSTVSGGGYIGSWLTAWTYRVDKQNREAAAATKKPDPPPADAFHHVARYLAGDVPHTSADPAQRPVRHLREYTSFLAPRLGLTLDTFALLAIVLRNLFVNWLMIVPLLFATVAALQVLRLAQFTHLAWVPRLAGATHLTFFANGSLFGTNAFWWGLAAVFFIAAGCAAGRRMPSSLPPMPSSTAALQGEQRVFEFFVLPLFIASQALIRIWFNLGTHWADPSSGALRRSILISFCGLFAICIIRASRQLRGKVHPYAGTEFRPRLYLLTGFVVSAVVSLVLGGAIYLVGRYVSQIPGVDVVLHRVATGYRAPAGHHWEGLRESLGAMFAFPVVWVLIMLASSLYSALLGFFEDDSDREWWARAGGLMLNILLLWIVGIGLVATAPGIQHHLIARLTGLAGLTGLLGALGGSSTAGAIGAAVGKRANLSAIGKFLTRYNLLLPGLCLIAILAASLAMAATESAVVNHFQLSGRLENAVRSHLPGMLDIYMRLGLSSLLGTYVLLLVAFAGIGVLANWVININLFSLHGMYRMRLMRAFMGASNLQRLPNAFTGFDGSDNIETASIRTGAGVPLHIINTTVNLVGTTNAAWRQRKAEGFTVSPLHSGGWRLGYTRTGSYGGPKGLTLATAMAISGAAFNPNMGYHSSPLVTLVMTLFNVRLGWWLPNPKYRSRAMKQATPQEPVHAEQQAPPPVAFSADQLVARAPRSLPPLPKSFLRQRSPRLSLLPMIKEAFGGTNDEGKYIELTDGGHFENLGLYEMVLRRVRWIVVIDGSADPACQLEDLGNAIRKIEIDLGIPITFRKKIQMQAGSQGDNLYCALAEIGYGIVDDADKPPRGHLLYIKAGLNGTEPPDVLQYARTHPTFPHESTGNQFFTESQFESYRHLGHHEVMALLREVRHIDGQQDKQLIRALFDAAERYTTPPALAQGQASVKPRQTVVTPPLGSATQPRGGSPPPPGGGPSPTGNPPGGSPSPGGNGTPVPPDGLQGFA